ncbi:MAG: alpha-ribazole phosphatase [Bacteroidota bacterium]
MEIHLIRHTTPAVDKGICYGQTDLQLIDRYPEELAEVKSKVDTQYDEIFCSPLYRCSRLADDLFLPQRILRDERLKEFDFGQWEMMRWDDIDKDSKEKWMADFVNIPAPDGESLGVMHVRVNDFIEELVKEPYERVALVTHSGVIRIVKAMVESTPLRKCFDYHLEYGAVRKLKLTV